MKPAAKFRAYRGHQIRLSQEGEFTIDGISGNWPTLDQAKKTIEAAIDKEVRVNALRNRGSSSNGKYDDLIPVVFLGMDQGSDSRARIEVRSGRQVYKTTCFLNELHPDTPAVREAWAAFKAMKFEAYKKDCEADSLASKIPLLKP